MTDTATPPLRLTGSQLAQFFRFRCERQLRWGMGAGDAAVPAPGARAGSQLLLQAGYRFERRMLKRLLDRHGPEAVLFPRGEAPDGSTGLGYEQVVEALRNPGPLRWMVQPELRVPASFAARFGIPADLLEFATARLDLLRVGRGRDGRVRLGVAEIKWSAEGQVQHFAQLAFYSLLLEEVCRAEGIDARVDRRRGWIWTRGSRGPRPFELAVYRHHVREFLRDDLPRIASAPAAAADWHPSAICTSCAWFAHCRAEADRGDHLARVPGITPVARQVLGEAGIRTVGALKMAAMRKQSPYAGSHALESGERRLRQRVQALGFRRTFPVQDHTYRMAPAESVRLLVSAEMDPVSGTCFALGLRVERDGGDDGTRVFLSRAGAPAAEREMLAAFLAHASAVVREAGEAPEGEAPRALHLYLVDAAEAETLRGVLERHLSSADVLPHVGALAGLLFPAEGRRRKGSAGAPGTVVMEAVAELFALPLAYAYDLAGVSRELTPETDPRVYAPREGFAVPMSSQVAYERAHDAWRARRLESPDAEVAEAGLRETVEEKLAALGSVVRAIRERAERKGRPELRMDAPAPPWPGPRRALAEPALERLRVFTELEAAHEALSLRAVHTLPTADRVRRFECIAGLEPAEAVSDHEWWFTFAPECREAKFRPGDFALVLANDDDGRTLVETDRKPYLRRKLSAELVRFDLSGPVPRVLLASDYGFPRLQREGLVSFARQCALDHGEADFNTRRVLATLASLDAGRGEAAFVVSALNGAVPGDWPLAPLDVETGFAASAGHGGAARLNAEQLAAFRAAFQQTATVVWGPPGTGKTYLLAWTLLGLCAAARAAGRPLRVLVSAVTHRAIVTALARVGREAAGAALPLPPRLVKLRARGSEADREAADAGVELVEDEKLERILAECDADGTPVIVGSTVWSLWKRMRAAAGKGSGDEGEDDIPIHPLFDVVVIDEASQMRVPESLVALSSIRRGGRVLLCGDDRQLAPIVRGSYPRGETLYGSAFTHFAQAFGSLALRESRRMNGPLTDYPRRRFYPGLHSRDPERRISISPAPPPFAGETDARLWEAVFRPRDSIVLCTYAGYTATARNPFEAELAARITTLARAGLVDTATGDGYDAAGFRDRALAVLSPHRAQNSAILAELGMRGWAHDELPVVDTVERMQGNEREMIVVSWAVADREFAEAEAEFLLDPHRFNVAVTRARNKLVVLVSEAVLRTLPRDEQVMARSLPLKGYPRQRWRARRVLELPAPGGGAVRLTVRVR